MEGIDLVSKLNVSAPGVPTERIAFILIFSTHRSSRWDDGKAVL